MSGLNDALNVLKELRKEYWEEGTGLHTDYYITMDDIDRLDKAIEIIEKQANGVKTGAEQCNLPVVSGSYSYEIDFGTHCRAGIDITNNEPKVIGAMNGWGDGISLADIKIKKL
ncbi:MAG: hypothetical protein ACOWWH_12415 [Eubacteriaceae bacterium]